MKRLREDHYLEKVLSVQRTSSHRRYRIRSTLNALKRITFYILESQAHKLLRSGHAAVIQEEGNIGYGITSIFLSQPDLKYRSRYQCVYGLFDGPLRKGPLNVCFLGKAER
jgi:hypothetical protein